MAIVSKSLSKNNLLEFALPAMVVGALAVMIIPMPSILLDLLLSLNITFGVIILFISLYILKPVNFSIFPTLLLVTTMFRLSLNVASTRLILLHGNLGVSAAGQVIKSFGMFVIGGNYAVGLVIFMILVIINFIVITKGAGRIAEVSARFTLDAMPGKQMSIDADLNAGLIGEEEARERRTEISKEAEFYGSMDGASKFVRGDAIAGILITFINIIGGLVIGIAQQGMTITNAISVYTILTIGDGLVAQIPSLVISLAAGIIVTRAASSSQLGKEFSIQIFSHPKALIGAAVVLFLMGLVPGLPHVAFLTLSIVTAAGGYLNYRSTESEETAVGTADKGESSDRSEAIEVVPPDLLGLVVGYRLISILDSEAGGDLLDRIKAMKQKIADDTGFIVPAIHIKDDLSLKPEEYRFLLKGISVGGAEIDVSRFLAIDPGGAQKGLTGVPAREPAFGLPAHWIDQDERERAKIMGYTVASPSIVLVTHLTEIIKKHSHEILTRQDVQDSLDNLSKYYPKVVEELVPAQLPLGGVQKVLQKLLQEGIPIRDMLTIIETIADFAPTTKDPTIITEHVRHALSRTITNKFATADGVLPVAMLDPVTENVIRDATVSSDDGAVAALNTSIVENLLGKISAAVEEMASQGVQPVLLTSQDMRRFIKGIVERTLPSLAVIGSNEISGDVQIRNLKVVRLEDAHKEI